MHRILEAEKIALKYTTNTHPKAKFFDITKYKEKLQLQNQNQSHTKNKKSFNLQNYNKLY